MMVALRPLFELCRIPNVFTALGDILAGYLVLCGAAIDWVHLAGLLAASASLYTAGVVLNDFFDRFQDAAERPGRPIPSGRVSPGLALRLGLGLLLVGNVIAATVSMRAAAIAASIAVAVLLYNGVLKRTPFAPPLMGVCRSLNLLLGMSPFDAPFPAPADLVAGSYIEFPIVWLLPLAMLVYIAGLTWFGRKEAVRSARSPLIAALCVQGLGLLVCLIGLLLAGAQNVDFLVPLAFVAFTNGRTGWAAIKTPTAPHVQAAVKNGILNIIVFDAAIVLAIRGFTPAMVVLALLLPSWFLGRWIYQT